MFAVSIILSAVESLLPDIFLPGVKLGLANIAVMFAFFYVGRRTAFFIGILRCGLVLLTRGAVTALFSTGGFLCSFAVLCVLYALMRKRSSFLLYSTLAAVAHNMGQLLCVSLVYSVAMFTLAPPLVIFGLLCGAITATLLRAVLPLLKKSIY